MGLVNDKFQKTIGMLAKYNASTAEKIAHDNPSMAKKYTGIILDLLIVATLLAMIIWGLLLPEIYKIS